MPFTAFGHFYAELYVRFLLTGTTFRMIIATVSFLQSHKSQSPREWGTESYGSFERSKPLQDVKTAEPPQVAA